MSSTQTTFQKKKKNKAHFTFKNNEDAELNKDFNNPPAIFLAAERNLM